MWWCVIFNIFQFCGILVIKLLFVFLDEQVAQIQKQMQQMRVKQQMPPQHQNMHSGGGGGGPSMFGLGQQPATNGWMPQQPMSFPQQQHPQYVTTGPAPGSMGYGGFPMGSVPSSGQTLSHQLWK